MVSLFILDSVGWWTAIGNLIKYGLVCAVSIGGVVLFLRSRAIYFVVGWLLVIVFPLFTISEVKDRLGARVVFSKPSHENIFIFVWLFIALVEFYVVWIPLIGSMLRSLRTPKESDGNVA